MLEITVVTNEAYNEESGKFVVASEYRVHLEHSLSSVSKWESVWKIPFLGKQEKTHQQTISYIAAMILDEKLPPEVFQKLIDKHTKEITDYISDEMSATKIHVDSNTPGSRETITSELIYYWMIAMNIPVEFEHWHLNRLITLIRVINLKNNPKKRMSNAERKQLNRQRLRDLGTRG